MALIHLLSRMISGTRSYPVAPASGSQHAAKNPALVPVNPTELLTEPLRPRDCPVDRLYPTAIFSMR